MFSPRPASLIFIPLALIGGGLAHSASAAPVITNVKMTPGLLPPTGGVITVTATITDTVAVTGASVRITGNTAAAPNNASFVMSNGGSGTTYSANVPFGTLNTTAAPFNWSATVTATDASATQSATVAVLAGQQNDNQPPAISGITLTPATLPFSGGQITVTATVVDPFRRPTTVGGKVTMNGGNLGDIALSNGGVGNIYTGTFQSVVNNTTNTTDTYAVNLTAKNDLGFISSVAGGKSVQDNLTAAPVITSASVTPSTLPATGGTIKISAVVNDPSGRKITKVLAYLPQTAYALSNGGSGNIYTLTLQVSAQSNPITITGSVAATNDVGLVGTATVNGAQGFANGSLPVLIGLTANTPALSPAFATHGAANLALTINGQNFVGGSSVLFNGTPIPASSVIATRIVVVIPAAMLATAGAYSVSVNNPAPGGSSNSVVFNVR
ncbi:MAG: hypothetical protein JWQ02_753 [Capsulimonas sp.]|nr:hypothetical protein [Capsulimonas sp.]